MSTRCWTVVQQASRRLLGAGALLGGLSCGGGDVQAPATGSIEITIVTSGSEPDADGYSISIDQGAETAIATDATMRRDDVDPGDHAVHLGGLAANCTIAGENPRTISVAAGETARVDFQLTCSATTGSLQVTASTTGPSSDPDGYSITVDGTDRGSVGPNASVTVDAVASGDHAVGLTGVAGTCLVEGDNPRTVTVPSGASVTVGFSVTCALGTGSIEVTTRTTGSNLDADGYRLAVDAATPQTVDINTLVTLGGLSTGTHTLRLLGIANNCRLEGNSSRSVEVVAGTTAPVTFGVSCAAPVPSLIAFTSSVGAIFVVNPDGTGLRRLTPEGQLMRGRGPVWSPDGRKLLFASGDDLSVMNPDGTGQAKLASGQHGLYDYRWSPDGSRIAFVDIHVERAEVFPSLWVMSRDGSGKRMVADAATSPTWSPDRRIAFVLYEDAIGVVNADESGYTVPTGDQIVDADQPAWSPDGSQIAFVAGEGHKDIMVMNADGTGVINLTNGVGDNGAPTWSPDSRRILFTSQEVGQSGELLGGRIAIMDRDGSHRVTLTSHPGFDVEPGWSTDGTRIVFTRWDSGPPDAQDPGDAEIYVMNSDGSGQVNVSNRPETRETNPDWNGPGQ